MNVKLFLVIGTVAAGWTWSHGFAQATEQDLMSSRPFEIAQSPGTGGSMGGGAPGGGVGPSGQTAHGIPRTNGMDTMGEGSGQRDMTMPQQGIDSGIQSGPGGGGLPPSGSAGSTMGGGGTNSLGPTSGGGSTGTGMSGGTSGGSAGMGASGGASGGAGR
jgi:hypothetical protein